MKKWVVRGGDGETVADIVARAGGDARAVEEGRVFVGRVRVELAIDRVDVGDEITIAPKARATAEGTLVIARDGDVVAVHKPAGIPTIADHGGASHALVARVAEELGLVEENLHPTSRLDREVSGVVLFALSKNARDRLAKAREEHTYARRYVAIAVRAPTPEAGSWNVPIGRAKDPRHRAANGREAVPARTHYSVVARAGTSALLALAPVTGRTHQLRVHAAHASAPLLGDRTYDTTRARAGSLVLPTGKVVALGRIALHAARVTVPREDGSPWEVIAPIPAELSEWWRLLGGDASAWDTATSCFLSND